MQVRGRKRVKLWAPEDFHCVSDGRDYVDSTNVDAARFGTFEACPFAEFVLGEGDFFFMPPHFAHEISSLDDTITLSHNMVTEESRDVLLAHLNDYAETRRQEHLVMVF